MSRAPQPPSTPDQPVRPRGRPAGTTKHGEPTTMVRVPESLKPQIVSYLDARRARVHGLAGAKTLPFHVLGTTLHLTPAHSNPPPKTIHHVSMRVPAGFPSPADDHLEEGCDLNELLVRNAVSTYFYTVEGDSMDQAGIVEGCKLIVDASLEARHGDVVIALIVGEGHTVKRLYKTETEVALVPESSNPIHQRRVVTEYDEWMVFGVVTNVIQQLRRR